MKAPLRIKEVAAALGVGPKTLKRWRDQGIGPVWFAIGRIIFYPYGPFMRWIEQR